MSYFLTEYIEEEIETLFDEGGVNYDDLKNSDDDYNEDDDDYNELYDFPPARVGYEGRRESSTYPAYAKDPPIENTMTHFEYTEYLRDMREKNNGDGDYDDYESMQNAYDPPEAIYDGEGNIDYY